MINREEILRVIYEFITSNDDKYNKLAGILNYIVSICDISKSKYFILGSFALRKHRTISDLDINMEEDEWKKFQYVVDMGIGRFEEYNSQQRWFFDMTEEYQKVDPEATDFSIEAFQKNINVGFPNEDFSLGRLMENDSLDVDKFGHNYFSLKTLLDWKRTMNRSKDQADIELILSIDTGLSGGNRYNSNSVITFNNCEYI